MKRLTARIIENLKNIKNNAISTLNYIFIAIKKSKFTAKLNVLLTLCCEKLEKKYPDFNSFLNDVCILFKKHKSLLIRIIKAYIIFTIVSYLILKSLSVIAIYYYCLSLGDSYADVHSFNNAREWLLTLAEYSLNLWFFISWPVKRFRFIYSFVYSWLVALPFQGLIKLIGLLTKLIFWLRSGQQKVKNECMGKDDESAWRDDTDGNDGKNFYQQYEYKATSTNFTNFDLQHNLLKQSTVKFFDTDISKYRMPNLEKPIKHSMDSLTVNNFENFSFHKPIESVVENFDVKNPQILSEGVELHRGYTLTDKQYKNYLYHKEKYGDNKIELETEIKECVENLVHKGKVYNEYNILGFRKLPSAVAMLASESNREAKMQIYNLARAYERGTPEEKQKAVQDIKDRVIYKFDHIDKDHPCDGWARSIHNRNIDNPDDTLRFLKRDGK